MGYERRSLVGWITAAAVVIAVVTYILALPIGILDMITSPDLGMHLVNLSGTLAVEALLRGQRFADCHLFNDSLRSLFR